MRWSRIVFRVAGVYGVLVLAPQYFMETKIGRDFPPPITHPEHFYGFIGLALVWQFVFFLIASDPPRYRPVMALAVLEKLAFGVPAIALFAQQRIAAPILGAGLIDLLLATLFLIALYRTRPAAVPQTA